MSPIHDIINFAVRTYLQYYETSEQASLLRADASFAAEPTKDLMIGVLERFRSLVNEEITTQVYFMKRRRNQEHSIIYRLPPELLVEIILATDPTSRSSSSFRTFTGVSKYWFDAIVQCPRIWSLVDLSAEPQSRKMEMTRRLCGLVEVQCKSDPFGLDRSLTELAGLNPPRLRSLVCVLSRKTEALLSFFQDRSSNIVDLAITTDIRETPERRFDLGTDGPSLCHVDMRKVALPWTSPRLSQLRTLTLENLKKDVPSINDLYNVLTSSPALLRLRLRYIDIAGQEGPEVLTPIDRPIPLPELRHLEFYHVPSIIPNTLVPLICSHSCQYLEVGLREWAPLEPNEGTLDLIISSVVTQSTLFIRISDAEGTPYVSLTSYPRVARDVWGDWDDHNTGIAVKVLACSADGPWGLFDELVSGLQAADWNPKDLQLSLDATQNASDTDTVLPLICNFIASFPTVTELKFTLPTLLSVCFVLRFLEGGTAGMSTPLPKLTSIDLRQATVFYDQEELENGVRSFLERRYPLHHPAAADAPPEVSPLARIFVPHLVAEKLRCAWPTTSLSRKEVLNNWRPM
ncbi:hypothetical protein FRC04_012132 [Tulasnella sp. 424]|nr:hypothetical protein FRC04_012132 [Tulasnella sp. 424]KAG8971060.1 hypothetical protein FRC05_011526 [Tulasnella sp. 425]